VPNAPCTKAASCLPAAFLAAAITLASAPTADAQPYGFATLPPGTLNHTTASAISKVLKEKAGMNVLVQPTAGDNVIIPMVGKGEAEIGIANAPEVASALEGGRYPDLRLIGSAHALRTAFFVRKDSPMRTIADLRGKKVALGYSAMRVIDVLTRAMLATGGLTEKDVSPVLVPNVVRGADDFISGAADMFFFAFGGPKVREVDATVGGLRVLEISEAGMDTARKVSPYGYLLEAAPGPLFIGVDKPMKVYSFDNLLFSHARVADDVIYKIIATLAANKVGLVEVQPVLREFSAAGLYKKYDFTYHSGALKYFKDNNIEAASLQ
jgi:TRAP transporter TAXI family solute receptor